MTSAIRVNNDDWVLCLSRTNVGCDYWHNTRTGFHFWRRSEPVDNSNKVAVIVPFRDLQPEQQRSRHLRTFVPAMTEFLEKAKVPFKIYIVEQSNDQRKFNRGKLLNIGFDLAVADGYSVFVLHDVDLIPSSELLPFYTQLPANPVHVARVWNRYSENPAYFGGIVTLSKDQYEKINGYPNNFWGWGGEDDELYSRVKAVGMSISAPHVGSIQDLEEMDLQTKLSYLKENSLLKCNNKRELLQEHSSSWQHNGLSNFRGSEAQYSVEEKEYLGDYCVKVTVELTTNGGHWSDARSGIADLQYDVK